jgi:hypothetical protein
MSTVASTSPIPISLFGRADFPCGKGIIEAYQTVFLVLVNPIDAKQYAGVYEMDTILSGLR